MSQINVNRIKDSNEGAPDFPSGVNVGGITSTVTLGVTNLNPTNVNVSGVVTATTLDGSLLATGTPTLGLGVTINTSGVNISGVATAGIVSATTLYGNGANLTGIALTIAPLNYNPALNGVDLGKSPGIGFTFNQAVKAGSGEVTLRQVGAAGTVVQTWGVGSSITYSNGDTISMSLVSDLAYDSVYHLSYPSGAFTNIGGDVSYVGTGYTFDTKSLEYQLLAWGENEYGALGLSDSADKSSPTQIPGTTWNDVRMGMGHAYGIKNDNTLWTWGRNIFGQLGQNTTHNINYNSPRQVPGTTWASVPVNSANDANHSMAIKTDGTLWSWGYNLYGVLGQNNTTKYSSPVQIPGTTWKETGTAWHFSAAVKTDGTLWTWGDNEYGILGINQPDDNVRRSSPVQVPGTTWKSVRVGGYLSVLATKTDGTLWGWGRNNKGILGQNSVTSPSNAGYSSPVQIPGTNWDVVQNGVYSVAATKTDGTLWTIGVNEQGQLGQNQAEAQLANVSSPVQVPGTTWANVGLTGNGATMATKTDGTAWVWGKGSEGELGLGTSGNPVKYSSPTQLPGTWNVSKFAGNWAAMMLLNEL